MAREWWIRVAEPDGSERNEYSYMPGSGVTALRSLEMEPSGNWGEATITAIPNLVDIRARDVVRVFTRANPDATWVRIYDGTCVLAGSEHSPDEATYRFVGRKRAYYETVMEVPVVEGGDVAAMARAAYFAGHTTSDMNQTWFIGRPLLGNPSVPDLGFVLGDRYPAIESMGEFLDALAATVGGFYVPTGETYSYAGTTYTEGEWVPPVEWGVRAGGAGDFFFMRTQPATLALREDSDRVRVQWHEASAEDVVDRVRLVYAAGYDPGLEAPPDTQVLVWRPMGQYENWHFIRALGVAQPLSRVFTAGTGYMAERMVPLEHPGDFMVDSVANFYAAASISAPGYARDGSAATFAETLSDNIDANHLILGNFETGVRGGVLYLDFQYINGINEASDRQPPGVDVFVSWASGAITGQAQMQLRLPVEELSRARYAIPLPEPVEVAGMPITGMSVSIIFRAAEPGARIYRAEFLVPDVDTGGKASERLARSFMRAAEPDVMSVQYVGLGPRATELTLTTAMHETLTLPVARIEYALTPERGVMTTYHVGQAYTGEQMSQRAVMEAMAQRATKGPKT